MNQRSIELATWLLIAVGNTVQADPITSIYEGTTSGVLAGLTFDTKFVISASADTKDIVSSPGAKRLDSEYVSILLVDIGYYEITSPTHTFVNRSGIVGLEFADGGDIVIGPENDQFDTWDMTTSIGPVSGQALIRPDELQTSGGVLRFHSGRTTITYSAVVVPEPSNILLLSLSGVSIVSVRRSKRNAYG